MSLRLQAVVCLAAALSVAGCRMADGPMPTPGKEDLNRLDDLRRDLGDVVAAHPEAKKDFADDLQVFVNAEKKPDAPAAINELAKLIGDATIAGNVKESATPPLLKQVWVALAARELSEKQVTTLQADIKTTLTGLGVPEPPAQAVSNQIGTVQKAVTERKRRWYEVF